MSQARDLAARLAANIFDRIESDRTLIRQNIEDVICDGLLLGAAKEDQQAATPLADARVKESAGKMVSILLADIAVLSNLPRRLSDAMEEVYRALLATGWKP